MGILFYLSLLGNHEPVDWTIRCEQWTELTNEIRKDQYLDEESKQGLIDYFSIKLEKECNIEP